MGINNIHSTLEKLIVPIDGLKHYGKNPRRGDVDKIAESLQENGQYKAIVVRAGSNEVLAGNHTLKAAKQLGWDKLAATFVDVDDDAAARIVLVDNRTNDLATYDNAELVELLQSLPTLDGTGFAPVDLADLIGGIEQEAAAAPDGADHIPEQAAKPVAKLGDVFTLGRHKVICGDSTSPAVLEQLLGDEHPDLMWTDPPYGVDYVGKTKDALRIENDGAAGLDKLLRAAFAAAAGVLRPGAPIYVAHADTERVTFEQTLRAAGFLIRQNLVWVKNSIVLGHSDYHYKHEPILQGEAAELPADDSEDDGKAHEPLLYGFTPGASGRLGRGGPKWYGPNNGSTVFEFPKPPANREHPTMKPVDLILAMLANSVRPGGLVFDPFAGSGSTLIAAHIHGADGRVVELDPRYVDVICARYQKLTGTKPQLAGKAVNFLPKES